MKKRVFPNYTLLQEVNGCNQIVDKTLKIEYLPYIREVELDGHIFVTFHPVPAPKKWQVAEITTGAIASNPGSVEHFYKTEATAIKAAKKNIEESPLPLSVLIRNVKIGLLKHERLSVSMMQALDLL